jgi:hypothetical protein
MVFGDEYGRETPVISSGYIFSINDTEENYEAITGDIKVAKTLCANQNSLVVSQNWGDENTPNSWIKYVKYYVKETSNEYYNLVMDRWYDSGDNTVWLSFNSADRNKVDEETYLILKNRFGSQDPVLEKARYKILAIENEAPDYIKSHHSVLGVVGSVTADVEIGTPSANNGVSGNPGWALNQFNTDIWETGQGPNSSVATGFYARTKAKFSQTLWEADMGDFTGGSVYDVNDGGVFFGAGLNANTAGVTTQVYMRIVGRSWVNDIDGDGVNEAVNGEVYIKRTQWIPLTNYTFDTTDSMVEISWGEPLYEDANFYAHWDNAMADDVNGNPIDINDLIYSVEFKKTEVKNRPEFDGKFFVKVEQDQVLKSAVMVYSLGYQWTTTATYDLSYIDSDYRNGAQVDGSATQAGIDLEMTTTSLDNGGWFNGNFGATLSPGWNGSDWDPPSIDISEWNNSVVEYSGDNKAGWWSNYTGGTWYASFTGNLVAGHWIFNGLGYGYGAGTTNLVPGTTSLHPDYDWSDNFYRDNIPATYGNGPRPSSDAFGFDNWVAFGSTNPVQDGGPINNMWHNEHATALNDEYGYNKFAELANKGVFGSGPWYRNFETASFWKEYVNDMDKTSHTGGTVKNNAFIDGAKARYWNDPTNDDEPHYYKPWSLRNGNFVQNGHMGEMVVSKIRHLGEDYGSTADGLYSELSEVGTYFQFGGGAPDDIYEVVEVIQVSGANHSHGSIHPRTTDFVTTITGSSLAVGEWPTDYFTESCVPCYSGMLPPGDTYGDGGPQTWAFGSNSIGSWPNSPNPGNIIGGNGGFVDGGYTHNYQNGCQRQSLVIRFKRVNRFSGDYCWDGDCNRGLDPSVWDPRGALHHDGRDAIPIMIKEKTMLSYNDDSPNNELGACWETEPKKDSDLDIYYEASGAIPMVLNKDNVFDFAPINSNVFIKRTTQGTTSIVPHAKERGNHRVSNAFMSGDKSDHAIITIVSDREEGNQINTYLHKGPYDINGVVDTSVSMEKYFQIGDTIVFEHSNGTKTQAKISCYYEPINPDDNTQGLVPNTFNTLSVQEFNSDTQYVQYDKGLLNGPKAFRQSPSQYPTGFYGIDLDVWNQEVTLPWFNCYAFGNGVESDRIRDDFNAPQIDNGVKVSTTFSGYGEEILGSGLIYSGIYNASSQVNNLNEFNMSQKITKELNPAYGSIQRLRTRDTDVVALAEDKILKILANKDALYNADGNTQLTASDRVLGTAVPFVGDYGISKNPESLAWDQYRMYFTDKQRGAVLRLSRDGLTPISQVGMKTWFRTKLKQASSSLGTFDIVSGEYNLTLSNMAYSDPYKLNEQTVSFNEANKGWVSFKSFIPSSGLSISGQYVTSYKHSIYKHYDNIADRNTFYDQDPVNSRITFLFNDMPDIVKSFKTISYEGSQAKIDSFIGAQVVAYTGNPVTNESGDIVSSETNLVNATDNEHYNLHNQDGWFISGLVTDLSSGQITSFKKKEGKWFNNIVGLRRNYNEQEIETDEFTVQGIGPASAITYIEVNPPNDCIPPCPSWQECIPCDESEGGCCVDIEQVIIGCMDETAENYDATATVDSGGCIYSFTSCMDPMAPNYDQYATTTLDTNNGQEGSEWSNACQPNCADCYPYQYGCTDPLAANYQPGATTGGRCFWLGWEVPCPQILVTDQSDPGYNADAYTSDGLNAPNSIGMIDSYIESSANALYPPCVYLEVCPDGLCLYNNECVECVEGCTDPNFLEFNPLATVSNPEDCITPNDQIPGCTDIVACNYDPAAILDDGTCEYLSCVGCTDPTATNFCPTCTISDDAQCCYGELGDDGSCGTPGCLDPLALEYCGSQPLNGLVPQWETLGMSGPCTANCVEGGPCGEYPDPDNPGQTLELGPCATYPEQILGCTDPEANNFDEFATVYEVGSCTYTAYGCFDPTASNYDEEWANTIMANAGFNQYEDCTNAPVGWNYNGPCTDCQYLFGCTDPDAQNYDDTAEEDDGSCIPQIFGCMDETAANYHPYATSGEAGLNDFSGTIGAGQSHYYDGTCYYIVQGCTDPTATNYNPEANTQLNWNYNSNPSYPWYWLNQFGGSGGAYAPSNNLCNELNQCTNIASDPLPEAFSTIPNLQDQYINQMGFSNFNSISGTMYSIDSDCCACEYAEQTSHSLTVENYDGDSDADMSYDD